VTLFSASGIGTIRVVEEKPWKTSVHYCDGDIVKIIVAFAEKSLRDTLKAAGGRWDPKEKTWHVPYGSIRGNTELKRGF